MKKSCRPFHNRRQLPLLFLVLFLGALVVDDLHVLGVDQLHAVLLGPVHAALEHQRQEHARHIQDGHQRIIGKLDFVIDAIGERKNALALQHSSVQKSGE